MPASRSTSSPLRVTLDVETLHIAERQLLREALEDGGVEVCEDGEDVRVVHVGPGERLECGGGAPVVALVDGDAGQASDALTAGAAGAVLVREAAGALVAAVNAVAAGLAVAPRAAEERLRRPVLSSREKQVLGLLVMGLTNAEIGRRLYLAESTVKYHLLSVYAKLGVRTRKEAAELVLDPSTGLDVGVLHVSGRGGRGGGYSPPRMT